MGTTTTRSRWSSLIPTGNTDEHDVTVSVTNVEENGDGNDIDVAASGWGRVDGGCLTDPDDGITGLMWQWYRATSIVLNPGPGLTCQTTECDARPTATSASSRTPRPPPTSPVTSGDGRQCSPRLPPTRMVRKQTQTSTVALAKAAANGIRGQAPQGAGVPGPGHVETEGDQTDQEL